MEEFLVLLLGTMNGDGCITVGDGHSLSVSLYDGSSISGNEVIIGNGGPSYGQVSYAVYGSASVISEQTAIGIVNINKYSVANLTTYNNSFSGLAAEDVQAAIDELAVGVNALILRNVVVDPLIIVGNGVGYNVTIGEFVAPSNKTQVRGIKLSDTSVLIKGSFDASGLGLDVGPTYFMDDGVLTSTRTPVYAGEALEDGTFALDMNIENGGSFGPDVTNAYVPLYSEVINNYDSAPREQDGREFVKLGDYYYVLAGGLTASSSRIPCIKKLDVNGVEQWTKILSDSAVEHVPRRITTDGTYLYIAWEVSPGNQAGIIKYDPDTDTVLLDEIMEINGNVYTNNIYCLKYTNGRLYASGHNPASSGDFLIELDPSDLSQIRCAIYNNIRAYEVLCYDNGSGTDYTALIGSFIGGNQPFVVVVQSNSLNTIVGTRLISVPGKYNAAVVFNDGSGDKILAVGDNGNYSITAIHTLAGALSGTVFYDNGSVGSMGEMVEVSSGNYRAFGWVSVGGIYCATYADIVTSGGSISSVSTKEALNYNDDDAHSFGCVDDPDTMICRVQSNPITGRKETFIWKSIDTSYVGQQISIDGYGKLDKLDRNWNAYSGASTVPGSTYAAATYTHSSKSFLGSVTARTQTELDTIFGTAAEFSFREGIVYESASDPTVDYDIDDTAEIERFFNVGDIIIAPAKKWICRDNSIGAAVWEEIIPDAPSDGNQYARKDAAWEVIAAGGGFKRVEVDTMPLGSIAFPISFGSNETKFAPRLSTYYSLFLFEVLQETSGIVGTDLIFADSAALKSWMESNCVETESTVVKIYYYEDQSEASMNALKGRNLAYSLLKSGKYFNSAFKTMADAYGDCKWPNIDDFIIDIYNDLYGIIVDVGDVELYAAGMWFPKNMKKIYKHFRDDYPTSIDQFPDASSIKGTFDDSGVLSPLGDIKQVQFSGQVTGMTTDVVITADNLGTSPITLTADGVKDIDTLISEWNVANPGDTITLTSGDGSQVPTVSITLDVITTRMEIQGSAFYGFSGSNPSGYTLLANNTKPRDFINGSTSIIKVYKLKDPISGNNSIYIKPVGVDSFWVNGVTPVAPETLVGVSKGYSRQTTYFEVGNIVGSDIINQDVSFYFNKSSSLIEGLANSRFLTNPSSIGMNKVTVMFAYGNGYYSKQSNPMKMVPWATGAALQIML